MAGSSGKIIFLLSRMSPVIRRCAGAVALRAVDPRDRFSPYRFRVGGRLVEGLAQQLGGQGRVGERQQRNHRVSDVVFA